MLTSASQLARDLACPASTLLPHAGDVSTPAGESGSAAHNCADTIAILQTPEGGSKSFEVAVATAVSYVPEQHRALCEVLPWDALPRNVSTEIPWAYDVPSGIARWLKKTTHRDYSDAKPTEICGTIDLVGVCEDHVYIGDIKTGWKDLGPPEDAPQLLIAALVATQLLDLPKAQLQWVRLHEGFVHKPTAAIDALDLEVFAEKLRNWYEEIQWMRNANPEDVGTNQGDHCHFCPALPNCPRARETALVLADGSLRDQVEQWPLPADSPLERLQQYRMCEKVTGYMKRCIYAEAKETSIDQGNGTMFGEYTKIGNEKLDGQIAMSVLLEMVPDIANDCASFSVSKASIKRGVKGQERGTLPKLIKEIRKRGGGIKTPKTTIGEYSKE